MAVTDAETAFVSAASVSVSLSRMFSVTPAATNPRYLIVSVLDRDEYSAAASGATGSLSGNGRTLGLTAIGSDGRGAGIIFTYQPLTGRYINDTYGSFDQLAYTSSSSTGDVASLSVYGASNLTFARQIAGDPWALMQADTDGYVGSATVVTEPGHADAVSDQATPDSLAAVAESFVGAAWNANGCWTLASTIAAEAGASLPVASSGVSLPGVGSGEWMVAFNGPAGQTGDWQSMVGVGDVVVLMTAGGTAHVTTCVSGVGDSAELIDNITFLAPDGQIQNSAGDGSASDVIVSAAHPAAQEFDGAPTADVVIYRLDTPVVTTDADSVSVDASTTVALAPLFGVDDPAGKPITEWQVFKTGTIDGLTDQGMPVSDHAAADALTVASLAGVSLVTGTVATTDTVEARAFNGTYWGDWQTLPITVSAATASPPVLETQTGNQTWIAGGAIVTTVPAGTFSDPQGEALVFRATLANGQALPDWLTFNTADQTFSGTAPDTAQTLPLEITATNSSGFSAADLFSASVQVPAATRSPGIVVTDRMAGQSWADGQPIDLRLPSDMFVDGLGLPMTFAAYQAGGPSALPWLSFDPIGAELSGTVPRDAAASLQIKIVARDTMGFSATDLFTATVGNTSPIATSGLATDAPAAMGRGEVAADHTGRFGALLDHTVRG